MSGGAREGFALPPGWVGSAPAIETEVIGTGDEPRLRRAILLADAAASLLRALREATGPLARRPASSMPGILGRIGSRFADGGDPMHREAVSWVAEEAALSTTGARDVVVGMARDWTAERLDRALRTDFPDPAVLDGFHEASVTRPVPGDHDGVLLRAWGGRLALHICAGNVPGVGATSLLRSLLVKCPLLLKPGRADVALPTLVARALAEEDPELARAVAVVYWPGDDGGELADRALAEADRVVVYGGNASVAAVRARVPITTPIVAYHHRLSVGAVGREALTSEAPARAVAAEAAKAMAAYDARGCVSPRIVWVERGGTVSPRAWAGLLAAELAALEKSSPAGPISEAAAVAIRHLVDAVDLREASGEDIAVIHADDLAWTVAFGPSDLVASGDLGRVVLVTPLDDLDTLPERLAPSGAFLQSVALASEAGRVRKLGERLAEVGVTRLTSFERVAWPPAWWRHDGQGPLLALVRWSTLEVDQAPRA